MGVRKVINGCWFLKSLSCFGWRNESLQMRDSETWTWTSKIQSRIRNNQSVNKYCSWFTFKIRKGYFLEWNLILEITNIRTDIEKHSSNRIGRNKESDR